MWAPSRSTVTLGLVSVASLAAGCASGYFLAQRKLGAQFEERLEKEIRQTKAFYQNLAKPDPEALAEMLLDAKEGFEEGQSKHQYDTTSDDVPQEVLERISKKMAEAEEEVLEEAEPIVTEHNAFENPAPSWVQEDEELERKNGVPYIISTEEFYNNEWDFTEGQLTYYEGDDVLADSRDEAIPEQYATVGELTLEKFGHGSDDPNVVHVCNEKMEMIFEVSRSTKSYSEDVLGFMHEDTPRRFRVKEEWDG